MKLRKKYIRIFLALVLVALLIGGLLFVKEMIFSNDEKVIYGNRLKGIEKVPITDETKNKIKEGLKENTSSVKVRISGKIIYIIMKVKEGTTLETAHNLGNKSLEYFSDDEKSFYDIQIMIDMEGESNQFPIIGYKQHSKGSIIWTKDRAES